MTYPTNKPRNQRDAFWEDSAPSRLEELTSAYRFEQRKRNAAGWRRNLLLLALVTEIAAILALHAAR